MSTRVRIATDHDGEHLARIDAETWASHVTPAPPPDTGAAFFEDGRQPDDVVVVEVDGVVAGYVLLGRDVPLPCADHVIDLKGLAVAPEYQRRGIGRMLIEAALDEARRRGATRIKSRVLNSNNGSLALHEVCGFEVEGRLRGEFLIDGAFVDDVLLARSIDA